MAKDYNPADWYWTVAGSTTQVFSSASGQFVAVDDAAFVAWKADGTAPTRIGTEAEMGEVLAPYQIRPVDAAVLDAYKDSQAGKLTVEIIAKVLFRMANDIRALEGKQPITAPQFKAFLKGLM